MEIVKSLGYLDVVLTAPLLVAFGAVGEVVAAGATVVPAFAGVEAGALPEAGVEGAVGAATKLVGSASAFSAKLLAGFTVDATPFASAYLDLKSSYLPR